MDWNKLRSLRIDILYSNQLLQLLCMHSCPPPPTSISLPRHVAAVPDAASRTAWFATINSTSAFAILLLQVLATGEGDGQMGEPCAHNQAQLHTTHTCHPTACLTQVMCCAAWACPSL